MVPLNEITSTGRVSCVNLLPADKRTLSSPSGHSLTTVNRFTNSMVWNLPDKENLLI